MIEPEVWFDAYHTHAAAGVFLLTDDRRLVLQLRDDKPDEYVDLAQIAQCEAFIERLRGKLAA